MTLNNKIILPIFIIILFGFQGYAKAQEELRDQVLQNMSQLLPEAAILPDVAIQKKTHPERIIFTQIKLAGDQADIDTFAKASPQVSKAQEIDKTAMALAEYNRIGNSFNMHDQNAPITVHTIIQADEYSSLQDMIIFDEFDETSYFQFKMYDKIVGIVPENAKRFSRLSLSKKSADRFFNIIAGEQNILAEFILIPTYSDNQNPITLDENDIWLMFARVAEFRLWSNAKQPQLLWYHRAPWYRPKDKTEIGDLYAKP